jgi:hypothetical protein
LGANRRRLWGRRALRPQERTGTTPSTGTCCRDDGVGGQAPAFRAAILPHRLRGVPDLLVFLRCERQHLVQRDCAALALPPLGLAPPARIELNGVVRLKVNLDLYAVFAAAVRTTHRFASRTQFQRSHHAPERGVSEYLAHKVAWITDTRRITPTAAAERTRATRGRCIGIAAGCPLESRRTSKARADRSCNPTFRIEPFQGDTSPARRSRRVHRPRDRRAR